MTESIFAPTRADPSEALWMSHLQALSTKPQQVIPMPELGIIDTSAMGIQRVVQVLQDLALEVMQEDLQETP